MITAQYSTPLALSSQIFHCSLPLRLDSYRGCSFSCSYCFARYRGGNIRSKRIAGADAEAMARTLARAASTATSVSPVVEFLRARVPVHFGGMSDPFQPAERRLKVTHQFLHALSQHQYPTVISTRSPLVASDEFARLLSRMPVVVQFSISAIDDDKAAMVEPLAPRPSRILRAMRVLTAAGVTVACRWQPFIPGLSPPPDEYVGAVAEAGARQVSFEHLKIPTEKTWNPSLTRGAGVIEELKEAYKRLGAHRDGREFILPASVKLPTILSVRAACRRHGVAFGAADNEFQYLSDGDACCSGVDVIAGFESVYRYTIPYMIKKQIMRNAEIGIIEDALWRPNGSIDRFLNSKSRMRVRGTSSKTVDILLRHKWNDITGPESPSRYFGIRFSGIRDRNGNNVYVVDRHLLRAIES